MTREEYIRWKQQDLEEQKTHSKEIAEDVWHTIEQILKKKFVDGRNCGKGMECDRIKTQK